MSKLKFFQIEELRVGGTEETLEDLLQTVWEHTPPKYRQPLQPHYLPKTPQTTQSSSEVSDCDCQDHSSPRSP